MSANDNFQSSFFKYISYVTLYLYVIQYIDLTKLIRDSNSTNVTIIPSLNAVINVLLAVSIA